jgi:hypothetical protein
MIIDEPINSKRRKLTKAACLIPMLFFTSCATSPKSKEPILVNTTNVKDIPSLISAIKQAGGHMIPDNFSVEELYKQFADTFVKNARAAADNGYPIPEWILDRLPPSRKVTFPILGVAILTIAGIEVAIPVATIIIATLASIPLLMVSLLSAIGNVVTPTKPTPRI